MVNPWGVEPQSKEPESFILSIELRVQVALFMRMCRKSPDKMVSDEMRGQNYGFFCNFARLVGQIGRRAALLPLSWPENGIEMTRL